jgi:glucose/arabinose dehydrogenase
MSVTGLKEVSVNCYYAGSCDPGGKALKRVERPSELRAHMSTRFAGTSLWAVLILTATVAVSQERPTVPLGDIVVAQRSGELRIIRDGTLDPDPITGVPDVAEACFGGLMDLRLHPKFVSVC